MKIPRILAVVLAGGSGGRLGTLTDHRAKPALPVAGSYHLIDIPLSNLHNSGFSDVWIVEQYQPKSLNDHLASGRPWDLDRTNGGLRVLPPFQGEHGEGFAEGNADALYRQIQYIREFNPDLVLVLSADHLYRLDYRDVVQTHQDAEAVLTMVTTRSPDGPSAHGVVETNDGVVTGFQYKPKKPETDLVAAEVFLYSADVLVQTLEKLVEQQGRLDDYGDQLIPYLVENERVVEHRLDGYWRDLGTPGNYHRAHLDLVDGGGLPFDDPSWPMLTATERRLPAFVAAGAVVENSLLAPGSKVSGQVERSVLGTGVVVEAGATVKSSVLLENVRVAAGALVENAVVDTGARLGPDTRLAAGKSVTVVSADGSTEAPSS